jgi:hypothetical protein
MRGGVVQVARKALLQVRIELGATIHSVQNLTFFPVLN